MRLFFILSLATLTFLSACRQPDDTEAATLRGYVTDAQGNPIPDAMIHLSYYSLQKDTGIPFLLNDDSLPVQLVYGFGLRRKGLVSLRIFRWYNNEPVVTLLNDTMQAGQYNIVWSGKNAQGQNVVSDIYRFALTTPDEKRDDYYYHPFHPDIFPSSANNEYYAKSDQRGYFSIPLERLAFNYDSTFYAINDQGFAEEVSGLSRVVRISAILTNLTAAVADSVFIPAEGKQVKLVFE